MGVVSSGTIPAYSTANAYDFVINVPNPTATALTFGVNDGNYGDNGGSYSLKVIQLAPVPEPSTWAVLFVGISVFGWHLRRRSRGLAMSEHVSV